MFETTAMPGVVWPHVNESTQREYLQMCRVMPCFTAIQTRPSSTEAAHREETLLLVQNTLEGSQSVRGCGRRHPARGFVACTVHE